MSRNKAELLKLIRAKGYPIEDSELSWEPVHGPYEMCGYGGGWTIEPGDQSATIFPTRLIGLSVEEARTTIFSWEAGK